MSLKHITYLFVLISCLSGTSSAQSELIKLDSLRKNDIESAYKFGLEIIDKASNDNNYTLAGDIVKRPLYVEDSLYLLFAEEMLNQNL